MIRTDYPRPLTRIFPLGPASDSAVRKGEVFEFGVTVTPGGSFKPERLVLADAFNWKIRELVIDGRKQIDQTLPGSLFQASALAGARWLDTLYNGSNIHVAATYHGDEAGQFRAALMGVDVPSASSVPSCPSIPELAHGPRAFSGPIRFRDVRTGEPVAATCDGPERVLPGEAVWFIARPHVAHMRVERIVLDIAGEEWSIEDIHVHGKSQFAQEGSIPGGLFTPSAVDGFVSFDTIQPAMNFSIKAAYHGTNKHGRFFGATCMGLVER